MHLFCNLLLVFGFGLAAARVQDRLGVAVGLLDAAEDQVAGRLKRDTAIEVRRHVAIFRITGILLIDHCRHALHGLHDLRFAADTVVQPVGDVLRGDA